jgi:hypothetical protein
MAATEHSTKAKKAIFLIFSLVFLAPFSKLKTLSRLLSLCKAFGAQQNTDASLLAEAVRGGTSLAAVLATLDLIGASHGRRPLGGGNGVASRIISGARPFGRLCFQGIQEVCKRGAALLFALALAWTFDGTMYTFFPARVGRWVRSDRRGCWFLRQLERKLPSRDKQGQTLTWRRSETKGVPRHEPVTHEVFFTQHILASLGLEKDERERRVGYHLLLRQKGLRFPFQLGKGPSRVSLDPHFLQRLVARDEDHAQKKVGHFFLVGVA